MDAMNMQNMTDGGGSSLPPMLNYFHVYYSDVVLWQSWVPTTQGQYVGTIFVILAFGIASTVLKTMRSCHHIWDEHTKRSSPYKLVVKRRTKWWLPSGIQLWRTLIQSLILAFALMFDYFNMLIVMTFNVGFLVAVVMGYVLGNILCSHVPENYRRNLKGCDQVVVPKPAESQLALKLVVKSETLLVGRWFLFLLPRACWITFMTLIIVWVFLVEGGLGFSATDCVGQYGHCVFGWHAILMSAAFSVFGAESLLAFSSSPLLPLQRPDRLRLWHVFNHFGSMVCMVLGIVSIYYYKKLTLESSSSGGMSMGMGMGMDSPSSSPPPPDLTPPPMNMDTPPPAVVPTGIYPFWTLYSPHAWLGVTVMAAWLLQLVGKILQLVFSRWGLFSATSLDVLRRLHRLWGRCIFVAGLATCALGLQDMQSSDLSSALIGPVAYPPDGLYAQLATSSALMAAAVGVSVFAVIEFGADFKATKASQSCVCSMSDNCNCTNCQCSPKEASVSVTAA